jgi:hypothetical protein
MKQYEKPRTVIHNMTVWDIVQYTSKAQKVKTLHILISTHLKTQIHDVRHEKLVSVKRFDSVFS